MLKIVKVKSLWQAFVMRAIRNDCRAYMTKDKRSIGYLRQIVWYFTKYLDRTSLKNLVGYLFYEGNKPVGYGLVLLNERKNEKGVWISGGLLASERGRGLGKQLFKLIVDEWGWRPLLLEVFDTNKAAKKIHRELGFVKVGEKEDGKVIVMRRPRNREQAKEKYDYFRPASR